MHRIKSVDLQEIWQFGHNIFVVSLSVPKLRGFEIERSILLRLLVQIILAEIANFIAEVANVRCSFGNSSGCSLDKFPRFVVLANLLEATANVSNSC